MERKSNWSVEEIDKLIKIVNTHPSGHMEGFKEASKQLSRGIETCKMHYYKRNKHIKSKPIVTTTNTSDDNTRKILYEHIKQNPGNLQEAFRRTANDTGKTRSAIESAYYSKTSLLSRYKNNTCFMMLSKDRVASNAKIFQAKDAYKPTKQRIKIWIAQLLGIRKEDL